APLLRMMLGACAGRLQEVGPEMEKPALSGFFHCYHVSTGLESRKLDLSCRSRSMVLDEAVDRAIACSGNSAECGAGGGTDNCGYARSGIVPVGE
ncbi:hypothetical protein, partial [Burkholderia ambifaria]